MVLYYEELTPYEGHQCKQLLDTLIGTRWRFTMEDGLASSSHSHRFSWMAQMPSRRARIGELAVSSYLHLACCGSDPQYAYACNLTPPSCVLSIYGTIGFIHHRLIFASLHHSLPVTHESGPSRAFWLGITDCTIRHCCPHTSLSLL